MHCWGYPGPAGPCQNSERAQASAAASSQPAAEGKRRCSAKQGGGGGGAGVGGNLGGKTGMGTDLICLK